jgi:hypothetical protein
LVTLSSRIDGKRGKSRGNSLFPEIMNVSEGITLCARR